MKPEIQQVKALLSQAASVRFKRLFVRALIASVVAIPAFSVEFAIMKAGNESHAQGHHADTGESLFFGLAFGIPAMIAAFALIIAIFNLVSMLTGTPRACTSAEKSIRKFYEGALTETGFVAKIFGKAKTSPDCLFYLVPEAVVSIGGWPGFQEHWSQVNADVIATAKKDSPAALSRFEFKFKKAEPVSPTRYKTTLSMVGFVTREKQEIAVCTKNYEQVVEVVEMDGRWYLTAGIWE
jgi:hypothetical protein